ncbi:bifunctional phosphopantothenoylcysteine decarboxylase/phosphopantothenate--cysteine ligase CoaBC [Desulfotomaculum sp. 1211_IL3151]|uniref:bifunctional phosphopantothenoylcysteine decarboxylase/phosphopantothenate--cysteine ligase CoaBC n=1 Tax=Desulfotomaculum sp. 1211_IL3151 TaxID=3084055 RepID=UPI002FDAC054
MLTGKKITVGITGGIAAYKTADLVSSLVKAGANVRVAMTSAAQKFITPLTLETLSGNPVHTDLFPNGFAGGVLHIDLAQNTDLLIIVPATANIIGKAANGIADDLVSTLLMAATCPVLFCPAMNVAMYNNPILQLNIGKLKEYGCHFVEPSIGPLACGTTGKGRLAELAEIVYNIEQMLTPQDLAGLRVLVTAGPTREPLDPVRYLTNRSSGKMGYALAKGAALRGAQVTLVSGPTNLNAPNAIDKIRVETAVEMRDAVLKHSDHSDLIIKAAAVADYGPMEISDHKIKKQADNMSIPLQKNPDILGELGTRKKDQQVLVGFAAETHNLERYAQSKLEKKNLDLLIANDVTLPGAGFDCNTNIVRIFWADGTIEPLSKMAKEQVAQEILDRAIKVLRARRGEN